MLVTASIQIWIDAETQVSKSQSLKKKIGFESQKSQKESNILIYYNILIY